MQLTCNCHVGIKGIYYYYYYCYELQITVNCSCVKGFLYSKNNYQYLAEDLGKKLYCTESLTAVNLLPKSVESIKVMYVTAICTPTHDDTQLLFSLLAALARRFH